MIPVAGGDAAAQGHGSFDHHAVFGFFDVCLQLLQFVDCSGNPVLCSFTFNSLASLMTVVPLA